MTSIAREFHVAFVMALLHGESRVEQSRVSLEEILILIFELNIISKVFSLLLFIATQLACPIIGTFILFQQDSRLN